MKKIFLCVLSIVSFVSVYAVGVPSLPVRVKVVTESVLPGQYEKTGAEHDFLVPAGGVYKDVPQTSAAHQEVLAHRAALQMDAVETALSDSGSLTLEQEIAFSEAVAQLPSMPDGDDGNLRRSIHRCYLLGCIEQSAYSSQGSRRRVD
jgi:hypothetical protein